MRSRQFSTDEHFAQGYTVDPSGCWLWQGHPSHTYPAFRYQGRAERVHRVSWMIHRGPIPPGMSVLHNCPAGDNTRCVNPAHLFLGTQADNVADMAAKGRHGAQRNPAAFADRPYPFGQPRRGEDNGRAKLMPLDVIQLRTLGSSGHRHLTLAERFGISPAHVSRICRRRAWRHLNDTLTPEPT